MNFCMHIELRKGQKKSWIQHLQATKHTERELSSKDSSGTVQSSAPCHHKTGSFCKDYIADTLIALFYLLSRVFCPKNWGFHCQTLGFGGLPRWNPLRRYDIGANSPKKIELPSEAEPGLICTGHSYGNKCCRFWGGITLRLQLSVNCFTLEPVGGRTWERDPAIYQFHPPRHKSDDGVISSYFLPVYPSQPGRKAPPLLLRDTASRRRPFRLRSRASPRPCDGRRL